MVVTSSDLLFSCNHVKDRHSSGFCDGSHFIHTCSGSSPRYGSPKFVYPNMEWDDEFTDDEDESEEDEGKRCARQHACDYISRLHFVSCSLSVQLPSLSVESIARPSRASLRVIWIETVVAQRGSLSKKQTRDSD